MTSPKPARETIDEVFARAALTTVPRFAGFYIDSTAIVVQLADSSFRGPAEHYVRSLLPRSVTASRGITFHVTKYDFAELMRFAEPLTPLIGQHGVYALDIDEHANKIWLGLADSSAAAYVRAMGRAAGIPDDAIVTHMQSAPAARLAATTFQDWTDSLRGGFQIARLGGLCTLGFNALQGTSPVFVSASHCSGTQYGLDNTPIYQNAVQSGLQIGSETTDRALYACQTGASSCRLSDASYFQYTTSRAVDQGYLQRGQWGCYGQRCTLAVDAQNALTVFPIVGKLTNNSQIPCCGLSINKVGRTSGWTYGKITQTCVTIGVLRCQYVTDTWSEPGDSGAPIWKYHDDGTFVSVELLGVLWGGPTNDFKTTYFSPLTGVEADLGTLSVCAPGYGC